MDIACPQCAAAYELDAATLGPSGRKVRCVACGEIWRVMPEGEAAPGAAVPDPLLRTDAAAFDEWPETPGDTKLAEAKAAESELAESEPAEAVPAEVGIAAAAPPEPPKPRWIKDAGPGRAKRGGWRKVANWRVGAVAATVLALAAGAIERERVVRLLPQTAKLYAVAGLPVNLRGIEIRNVKSRLVNDNEEPVLVVDGDLVNVADRRVDVPRLHFALLGPDGRQIYVWSAQADRASLQAGESLNFRRRLAAPPGEAREVSVRFVTRSDITAGIR